MSTAITDPAWKFRSHADVKKENKWLWVRKIKAICWMMDVLFG